MRITICLLVFVFLLAGRACAQTPELSPPAFETSAVPDVKAMDATDICVSSQRIYCGLAGGGLLMSDKNGRNATSLTPTPKMGPVRAMAVGGGSVWWLAGNPGTLMAFSVAANKVTIFNIPDTASIKRLEYWSGRLAMIGARGVSFLDPKTKTTELVDAVFPDDLAEVVEQSAVYLAQAGDVLSIAAVRPVPGGSEVYAYKKSGESGWQRRLSWFTASQMGGVAIDSSRLALYTPGLLLDFSLDKDMPVPRATPISLNGTNFARAANISLDGADLWALVGGTVLRVDLEKQSAVAYLPWSGEGIEPKAIVPEAGKCWAAGKCGFGEIKRGDSGGCFVIASLDPQTETPPNEQAQRLAGLVEQWQGTPYKYGGSSRQGTDCSGFVMAVYSELGIKLPHGSAYLKTHRSGVVVKDRLQYGDVLVEPGHASLYIGNGKTAETLTGVGVGKGTIWRKKGVTVRRFLPTQGQNKTVSPE